MYLNVNSNIFSKQFKIPFPGNLKREKKLFLLKKKIEFSSSWKEAYSVLFKRIVVFV